jgi:hypothetical protein
MRNLLQKLPFPVEFAVVVAGAFGLTIVTSLLVALKLQPGAVETEPERVAGGGTGSGNAGGARRCSQRPRLDGGAPGAGVALESTELWGLALAAGSYVAIFLVFMLLAKLAPGLIPHAGKAAASATRHADALRRRRLGPGQCVSTKSSSSPVTSSPR